MIDATDGDPVSATSTVTGLHRPAEPPDRSGPLPASSSRSSSGSRESVVFTFALPGAAAADLRLGVQHRHRARRHVQPVLRRRDDRRPGLSTAGFQNLAISIPHGARRRHPQAAAPGTPMPPAAYFVGKVALVLRALVAQVVLLLLIGVLVLRGQAAGRPPRSGSPSAGCSLLGLVVLHAAGHRVLRRCPRPAQPPRRLVTPIVLVLQFISGRLLRLRQPAALDAAAGARSSRSSGCARGCARCSCPDSFRLAGAGRQLGAAARSGSCCWRGRSRRPFSASRRSAGSAAATADLSPRLPRAVRARLGSRRRSAA